MVYGIIRLINFAHGEVFMVGAFATYFLFTFTPYGFVPALFVALLVGYATMRILDFWRGKMTDPIVLGGGLAVTVLMIIVLMTASLAFIPALLISMLVTGVLGIFIDRIAYKPIRSAPRNSMLITAIAVSLFLQNFGLLAFTDRQNTLQARYAFSRATSF